MQRVAIAANAAAKSLDNLRHNHNVGNKRHVMNGAFALAQKGRRDKLEGRILRARNMHLACKRRSAFDDDFLFCHKITSAIVCAPNVSAAYMQAVIVARTEASLKGRSPKQENPHCARSKGFPVDAAQESRGRLAFPVSRMAVIRANKNAGPKAGIVKASIIRQPRQARSA